MPAGKSDPSKSTLYNNLRLLGQGYGVNDPELHRASYLDEELRSYFYISQGDTCEVVQQKVSEHLARHIVSLQPKSKRIVLDKFRYAILVIYGIHSSQEVTRRETLDSRRQWLNSQSGDCFVSDASVRRYWRLALSLLEQGILAEVSERREIGNARHTPWHLPANVISTVPKPSNYVSRPLLESQLDQAASSGSKVIVISGPPGFGKTYIARNFISRQSSGTTSLWLDASSEEALSHAIFDALRIRVFDTDAAGRVRLLCEYLNSEDAPHYVVFDDATQSTFRFVLDERLRSTVIITSQECFGDLKDSVTIFVRGMSRAECHKLVPHWTERKPQGPRQHLRLVTTTDGPRISYTWRPEVSVAWSSAAYRSDLEPDRIFSLLEYSPRLISQADEYVTDTPSALWDLYDAMRDGNLDIVSNDPMPSRTSLEKFYSNALRTVQRDPVALPLLKVLAVGVADFRYAPHMLPLCLRRLMGNARNSGKIWERLAMRALRSLEANHLILNYETGAMVQSMVERLIAPEERDKIVKSVDDACIDYVVNFIDEMGVSKAYTTCFYSSSSSSPIVQIDRFLADRCSLGMTGYYPDLPAFSSSPLSRRMVELSRLGFKAWARKNVMSMRELAAMIGSG